MQQVKENSSHEQQLVIKISDILTDPTAKI